jgi:hypothetical protein
MNAGPIGGLAWLGCTAGGPAGGGTGGGAAKGGAAKTTGITDDGGIDDGRAAAFVVALEALPSLVGLVGGAAFFPGVAFSERGEAERVWTRGVL